MEAKIQPVMKCCPVCGGEVNRPRAAYCGEKCRRKAEYKRLKPQIYAYHAANRERIRQKNREWCAANPEKIKAQRIKWRDKKIESTKAWKARNPERVKELRNASAKRCPRPAKLKEWRDSNPEKVRAYKRKWAKANKGKVLAKTRRRQAQKLMATPAWLTDLQHQRMEKMYRLAALCSRDLGSPREVDHIVPLKGKNVCGLHVPWNLQILPKEVNRKKGNRFKQGVWNYME